jgi:cytochrome b-561
MAVLFSLFIGIVSILAGLFIAHPVEAFGPPGPSTPEVKPEWYFLWIYGFLQLIPADWDFRILGVEIGPQFLGLIVPILVVILGFAWPFIDAVRDKQRYLELPSRYPWRTGATMGVIGFFLASTLAAYKSDLGLSIALLWLLIVLVPAIFTVATALIVRAVYGPGASGRPSPPRRTQRSPGA